YSLLVIVVAIVVHSTASDFNKDFFVTWSPDRVITSADGNSRSLALDRYSGSGFASYGTFLYGHFSVRIKLVPGNSAGTVVAFYLVSEGDQRDELDFEFLGDVEGKLYTLQTNVYVNGFDDREQRIRLWFDPTVDFHTYSILWNDHQIVFFVDWVPIRTYRNHYSDNNGVPYPSVRPMRLMGSIWNGENWATNGGQTKINWAQSPFEAQFMSPIIDACIWAQSPNNCSMTKWWNNPNSSSSLNWMQRRLYKWVRLHYLNYDYCRDNQRFNNTLPKECALTKY
ncbi:hypothetical protein M569_04855, partial [Genlisea aurea]